MIAKNVPSEMIVISNKRESPTHCFLHLLRGSLVAIFCTCRFSGGGLAVSKHFDYLPNSITPSSSEKSRSHLSKKEDAKKTQ
jgi:hypothetical protein